MNSENDSRLIVDETEFHKSSCSQMFFRIDALKNFLIVTRKHLCQSLFLIKLLKKETPTKVLSCEYCKKFYKQLFYSSGCFWVQQSIENILRSNFFRIPSTTCCTIQFDMKVYVLQLKQKSTAGAFHRILSNFRTATFKNNLGTAFEIKIQKEEEMCSDPCGFGFSFFPGQLFSKS